MDLLELLLSIMISSIVELFVIYLILWKYNLKNLITLGRRGMSIMRNTGLLKEQETKQVRLRVSGKQKIADGALKQLPGPVGDIVKKFGLSPDELFALAGDENFIKGLMVILQGGGQFLDWIQGLTGKGKAERKTEAQASMPYHP